ncbi:MAG TPA: hypothetical protein ENH33_04860 [Actinobacteria bacterium]|nr:hypothetical protein [Actinomycetota bacterium]
MDGSNVALAIVAGRAETLCVPLPTRPTDLSIEPLPEDHRDLLMVFHYADRAIFSDLAVAPGQAERSSDADGRAGDAGAFPTDGTRVRGRVGGSGDRVGELPPELGWSVARRADVAAAREMIAQYADSGLGLTDASPVVLACWNERCRI